MHGRVAARHVHRPAAEIARLEASVLGERRRGHDSGHERDEHHRRLPHFREPPVRCRPDRADTAHPSTLRAALRRDLAEPPACAIRTARVARREDAKSHAFRLAAPRTQAEPPALIRLDERIAPRGRRLHELRTFYRPALPAERGKRATRPEPTTLSSGGQASGMTAAVGRRRTRMLRNVAARCSALRRHERTRLERRSRWLRRSRGQASPGSSIRDREAGQRPSSRSAPSFRTSRR